MSSAGRDRSRGDNLATRFGGAMTGVGFAACALDLAGVDSLPTPYVSVTVLLVGVALLGAGHRGRHPHRP